MFNITEQRLVGEKNNILKRKQLSDLELEETQRNIEDIGHLEVALEYDEVEGWFLEWFLVIDVFMKECEVVLEDCMVPNVEEKSNFCSFCNKDEYANCERRHDHT